MTRSSAPGLSAGPADLPRFSVIVGLAFDPGGPTATRSSPLPGSASDRLRLLRISQDISNSQAHGVPCVPAQRPAESSPGLSGSLARQPNERLQERLGLHAQHRPPLVLRLHPPTSALQRHQGVPRLQRRHRGRAHVCQVAETGFILDECYRRHVAYPLHGEFWICCTTAWYLCTVANGVFDGEKALHDERLSDTMATRGSKACGLPLLGVAGTRSDSDLIRPMAIAARASQPRSKPWDMR